MPVTADAILATVSRESGLDPDKVTPDATLQGLDLSSLDLMSVVFALEDEFGIEIVPEDIVRSWTLAQLTDHIARLPAK